MAAVNQGERTGRWVVGWKIDGGWGGREGRLKRRQWRRRCNKETMSEREKMRERERVNERERE